MPGHPICVVMMHFFDLVFEKKKSTSEKKSIYFALKASNRKMQKTDKPEIFCAATLRMLANCISQLELEVNSIQLTVKIDALKVKMVSVS